MAFTGSSTLIMVGWGGIYDLATGVLANKSGAVRNISRLLIFKLGAKGALHEIKPVSQLVLDPPAFNGKPEHAAHGAAVFGRYCAVCRGDAAVAGGLVPDLCHFRCYQQPRCDPHSGNRRRLAAQRHGFVQDRAQARGSRTFAAVRDQARQRGQETSYEVNRGGSCNATEMERHNG